MSAQPTQSERVKRADSRRSRDAVVNALLALFQQGVLRPSAADVAELAGVSERSIFRYFADLEDLAAAAVEVQQERVLPYLLLDTDYDAPLHDRVDALVQHRIRLFTAIGNVGRVTRLRSPSHPAVAEGLKNMRGYLRSQVKELFGPELKARPRDEANSVMSAIDVLTSFEAFDLMQSDQGLSTARVAEAMRHGVLGLLTGTGGAKR
jgi:TetR/AcrR family transcriptional regulator, regulator of autoinduction and epiphytic fitness